MPPRQTRRGRSSGAAEGFIVRRECWLWGYAAIGVGGSVAEPSSDGGFRVVDRNLEQRHEGCPVIGTLACTGVAIEVMQRAEDDLALSPACRLVPKALVKLVLRSETSASGRILATRNINVTAAVLAMAVFEVRNRQERSVMRSICTCKVMAGSGDGNSRTPALGDRYSRSASHKWQESGRCALARTPSSPPQTLPNRADTLSCAHLPTTEVRAQQSCTPARRSRTPRASKTVAVLAWSSLLMQAKAQSEVLAAAPPALCASAASTMRRGLRQTTSARGPTTHSDRSTALISARLERKQ